MIETSTPTVEPKLRHVNTAQETADWLGICRDTVYRLHKRGLLRSAGKLRTKIFTKEEIERYLGSTLN